MSVEYQSGGPPADDRPWWPALRKGLAGRCPNCGHRTLFRAYLKVSDHCGHCGEDLSHQRADDAPPYITIMIVGHLLIPFITWLEIAHSPPYWLHALIWLPLVLGMCLWILPVVKGGLVNLQWALRMHGFGGDPDTV